MERLLAQAIGVAPELPRPEPMEHYLFVQPWPVAAALAALGLVILFALNRRGEARKALIGCAGLLLAGVGVVALATLVETDRELITRQTRQLIERAVDSDEQAVRMLVASDLRVGTMDHGAYSLKHDQFLDVVRNFQLVGVRDWSASPKGSSIDGPNTGRVDFAVRVATSGGIYTGPMPSVWRFTWRQSREGEWRLNDLACLTMFGRSPNPDVISRARQWAN